MTHSSSSLAKPYLKDRKILIADANSSSRACLAKLMIDSGARTVNLSLAPDLSTATEIIRDLRPSVVVTDYTLSGRSGLDLIDFSREAGITHEESLFVVVTGNLSQTAIARAAEEDVDAFIVKPYTVQQFKQTLEEAIANKLQPSEYIRHIQEGKRRLAESQVENAIRLFTEASKMDPAPSLAFFYKGQAELAKMMVGAAENSYREGLVFNKIHYRCLAGLFDLFLVDKKYHDAYMIAKKLSGHFPANPKRLAQVMKLAVITGNYQDIAAYYEVFKEIDERDADLFKHVCAALLMGGKFFLRRGYVSGDTADTEQGIDLMRKASITAMERPSILRDIITTLANYALINEAEQVLKRFAPEHQNGVDFLASQAILDNLVLKDPRMVIHRVRSAVDQGLQDPVAYQILVQRFLEIDKPSEAEEWKHRARQRWPDLAI